VYTPKHNIVDRDGHVLDDGKGQAIVTNRGVGDYWVDFVGLASSHGNAIVAAADSSSHTCQVVNWGPVHVSERVSVACFDRFGARAHAKFTVVFADKAAAAAGNLKQGYLWADRHDLSTLTTYVPKHVYSSNGSRPTVRRIGTGRYEVTFPTRANPNVAHVSAFGTSPARCQVESTVVGSAQLRMTVKCASPSGAAKNTRFSLNYGEKQHGIYAWGVHEHPSLPVNTSYTPTQRGGNEGDIHGIVRTGVGQYRVTSDVWGTTSLDKVPMVTTTGTTDGHCKVKVWGGGPLYFGPDEWVTVACRSATGALQDQTFNVSFIAQ
jgi:hypothetical protein